MTADTAGTTWITNGDLTGRYLLSGIDVTDVNDPQVNTQTATGPGTIAVLGDQTSGAGDSTSTTWVDMLGKDPQISNPPFDPTNGPGPNPGGFVNISNAGASVAGADSQFGSAPNATVLDEPDLKAVLITLGLNDLKNGASAGTIETNINTLVSSLSPYGITNHYNPDGTHAVDVHLATVPDAPASRPPRRLKGTTSTPASPARARTVPSRSSSADPATPARPAASSTSRAPSPGRAATRPKPRSIPRSSRR